MEKYYDWWNAKQYSMNFSKTHYSSALGTNVLYLRFLTLNYNMKRY